MQSIDTGIANYLSTLGVDEAKKLRIAQNNQKFKEAVLGIWADNPDGAEFLLAHTNSLYFKKDDAPRTGPDKNEDRYMLGVYLDDPTARAELNGRRELLRLALAQEGVHVDDIAIHPALRSVKEHHLFPDSIAHMNELFNGETAADVARPQPAKRNAEAWKDDQTDLLETLKRAFCLTFEGLDQVEAFLEKIEGAALVEVKFDERARHGVRWYWCHLYVADEHLESMKAIVEHFGETTRCRAKRLGLGIRKILVHASPAPMRGHRAFPSAGRPEPLPDLDIQELRSESARVAAEVRAKIRRES